MPKLTTKEMHINISDALKKQFHATCIMQGKKMNQVVIELIEHWLKANETSKPGSETGNHLPPKSYE